MSGQVGDVRVLCNAQEIWRATQEQVAANDELLKQLSTQAGLPTELHATGNLLERLQELHSGALN